MCIIVYVCVCECVYVCVSVSVCVCVCVCLFCTLDVSECNPFLAVHFLLHCSWIIAFILYICCVTVTPVHRCVCVYVCVCVWEWMCWFCTLDVLEFHPIIAVNFFSALWQICRLYTQKCAEFLCFCQFPIHFLWSVIFDRRPQVWLFFSDHLACSNQALNFLCVHYPNAIKVTKFHTIQMKLWFKKHSKHIFVFKNDWRAPEGKPLFSIFNPNFSEQTLLFFAIFAITLNQLETDKEMAQAWMWLCCFVPQVCCRWTLRWISSSAASITCQWREQGANRRSVTLPRLSSISQTLMTTRLSLTAVATVLWLQRTFHQGTWFCRYHAFPYLSLNIQW